ncbi:MAG: GNAT family N-acetyltransferase [Steroidobacteraceae bacterium]
MDAQLFPIHPAIVTDAAQILALQNLAYESEARLYEDWTIPPMTQTLESVRSEIQHDTVLKAVDDQTIIGSVRATVSENICQIGRLMVHPTHQGRGIGTALMQAIEARFPAVSGFELFTGSRSEGNIRLYVRLGYAVTGARRVSDRVTLVVLSKSTATSR